MVILPPVEVSFLGHSCFRLKGKEAVLLADPFDPSLGYTWPNPQADIVTISHSHPGHSYRVGVGGDPRIIQGPGEYETKGVFVLGLATYHDGEQGKKLGRNTIYLVEMDDVRVLHLGDLGHPLTSEMVGELGRDRAGRKAVRRARAVSRCKAPSAGPPVSASTCGSM